MVDSTQNLLVGDAKKTLPMATKYEQFSLQEDLEIEKKLKTPNINLSKKQHKQEQPMENDFVVRLAHEFIPQPPRKDRKTKSIFHDNVKTKDFKTSQYLIMPSVPAYSPVDEGPKTILLSRQNKYPYANKKLITVEEMKKPRISSVGVLPARASSGIQTLSVVLEGASVSLDNSEVKAAPKLYNTPASSFILPVGQLGIQDLCVDKSEQASNTEDTKTVPRKPAILPGMGVNTIQYSERVKPAVKVSYLNQRRKKVTQRPISKKAMRSNTAESFQSSFLSSELSFVDDATYTINDGVSDHDINDDGILTYVGTYNSSEHREVSSGNTVKSLEELLEEAKQISSNDSQPIYQQNNAKADNETVKIKVGVSKGTKLTDNKTIKADKVKAKTEEDKNLFAKELVEIKRDERTVDEIIASLKDQTAYNQETEADKKIKEIMQRVMSRTNMEGDEKSDDINYLVKNENIVSVMELDQENNAVVSPQLSEEAKQEICVNTEPSKNIDIEEPNVELLKIKPASSKNEITDQLLPVSRLELSFTETDYSEENKELHENEEEIKLPVDFEKVWRDLNLPPEATAEEILNVQGENKPFQQRKLPTCDTGPKPNVITPSVSFLSTWEPKPSKLEKGQRIATNQNHISVHHFCHNAMGYQLPPELIHVGRKYHTPDRFPSTMPSQPYRFKPGDLLSLAEINTTIPQDSTLRQSQAADKIVHCALDEPTTLTEWQEMAEKLLGEQGLMMTGKKMALKCDESQVYWTPAPPKLVAAPNIVKELLFPEYQLKEVNEFGLKKLSAEVEDESDSSEEENNKIFLSEQKKALDRTVRKRHNSDETEILSTNKKAAEHNVQDNIPSLKKSETILEVQCDVRPQHSAYGLRQKEAQTETVHRPISAPCSLINIDESLIIHQDYNTAMDEIKEQKILIEKAKQRVQSQEVQKDEEFEYKEVEDLPLIEVVTEQETKAADKKVIEKATPAEEAIKAGRNYVMLPKKKKKKKGKRSLDEAKVIAAEQMLMNVRPISRRESMPKLHRMVHRELRVSWQIRHRRYSVPSLLNFNEYKTKKRMHPKDDEREWVRGIWNVWFDEVFPQTPQESDEEDTAKTIVEDKQMSQTIVEIKKSKQELLNEILSQDIEAIEPITDTPEHTEIFKILQEEIIKLSQVIDNMKTPTAFDLCRRGALYRKIGQLKKAEVDLDRAIAIEPDLLDAYWHRHLLYILQERKTAALDDLNFIMKKNKSHSGAYRSMAEIQKQQNDITMAIINYSSAIKYNPSDHEAYFQRAQLYEQRGDMLLAMEDYTNAMKIMPSNTAAIMKHGKYYFQNENWSNAINDFTELIKVEPLNSEARLLRGRAYAKLNNWVQALQDFSAAIHLDPVNWQAFYQRACILRKAHPEKALLDLSISLLLNDTEENIMAYQQRGILYDTLGKSEDAIQDFESVLKLNKDSAPAHVNLGLIFMKSHSNYHRAIKQFTAAIKVDPTYVRAYVCRAEAHQKIHELKNALKDFTRAIHIHPDIHYYYMYRGQLVLLLGHLDLAAFCVRYASELGMENPENSFGVSPNQQAVVQSFLKNYDKAVDALQQAARSQPTAATFMLLGKMYMKAKQYEEAVKSFSEALDKMKPWTKKDSLPKEAAEAHYLSGICHTEIRNYTEALQQFNQAIKLNSSYADAYYQRGLASIKLKHVKGIQDFNRALALNPKLFQVYLSRACYYGQKGKYAKAILNCNEAIKLQPKCIRGYLYRGALKYWIKSYELAILDLTKAASLDTECPLAYFNRALCYHESGQHEKALKDYSIVLMLGNMLDLKVLVNRGLLYFEKKDYTNALFDLQAAARLHPTDNRIQHTLGLCYHKLGCLKESVATFTKCLQLKPFFLDGFIARGNVYMDYGHSAGIQLAKRDYQRAIRLDPLCLPARINLAYTAQVSGKLMQAWKYFTAIIEVQPDYRPALEGRSIVNLQVGSTFAAYQDISMAINYGPTAESLTNRGVINQFTGDSVMAMQDYQKALQLDPTFALAYYNAGNIYFHTRHFKQALEYYTMAIKYNNQNESAFINSAITKVLLHDTQGAFEDFEKAAKLCPFSSHIYFNRANLYMSMGKYESAEKEYTDALKLKPDDPLMLKRRADVRGHLGKQMEALEDYKRAVAIQLRPNRMITN